MYMYARTNDYDTNRPTGDGFSSNELELSSQVCGAMMEMCSCQATLSLQQYASITFLGGARNMKKNEYSAKWDLIAVCFKV